MNFYHTIDDEFTVEEILEVSRNNRLLTAELELSLYCNFACPYCYTPTQDELENELSLDEIKSAIDQIHDLGARRIVLLGGEPTVYKNLFEVIDYIRSLGIEIELFTNGAVIDKAFAQKLFERKVLVVVKLNSFDKEVCAKLTARKDALKISMRAIEALKAVGYPQEDSPLAISTIICRQNIDEIIDMWCWARDENILPYFEIITPQGSAKDNDWLDVSPQELEKIFQKISDIDREKYGVVWDIQPPLVAGRCLRHQYSCLITSQGFVMPCVGVTVPAGNIREKSLATILQESEVIQGLKQYPNSIKGPCGSCDKAQECYGCRGAAYQLTGDPLASDPLCWRNQDKLDEIYSLPYPAENLLPQKGAMRFIDELIYLGDLVVKTRATIREDNPYLNDDNTLSESAYAEFIAQSIAASNGFEALGYNKEPEVGFIVGVKNLHIHGTLSLHDTIEVHIKKEATLGDFGVVLGEIYKNDTVIAAGQINIFCEKK